MKRSEIMRVDLEFAKVVGRLRKKMNQRIERSSGIKFDRKPITNIQITRMLGAQLKPSRIVEGLEINLKKNKIKVVDGVKWF